MNVCLLHKGKRNTSGVKIFLQYPQYNVEEISLEEVNTESLRRISSDVIIFDVVNSHGDCDDIILLQKIQEITKATPILLATRDNEEASYRENMLDAGVDGCVQLPFLPEELFLRLEKLIKKKNTLLFNGININFR